VKGLSWPVALIATSVVAGTVVLAAMGKDAESLVTLVTLGISALLYGKVNAVEHNTNGSATKQQEIIQEALRVLAMTPPAPIVTVKPLDPPEASDVGD
jgi:hypothetical protein